MRVYDRKSRAGFTLIELMVVILIVAILASIAIPILRGRIDETKWSEGKAMMGSIATAIRAYHGEKGLAGAPPTSLGLGATGLGFIAGDLTGTYFVDGDFSFSVTSMNPLQFTVTANKATLTPTSYRLDQAGNWTNP
ncbi:MAG TPA: prepilin-type N-terminal cleavage/methylation domain-containing protein [Sedimentisphaerales bacterium]|nr:prepilin-type N-terminal cleavage/methylation domain-containing protein [Sedimentisphaerales bacterium]